MHILYIVRSGGTFCTVLSGSAQKGAGWAGMGGREWGVRRGLGDTSRWGRAWGAARLQASQLCMLVLKAIL